MQGAEGSSKEEVQQYGVLVPDTHSPPGECGYGALLFGQRLVNNGCVGGSAGSLKCKCDGWRVVCVCAWTAYGFVCVCVMLSLEAGTGYVSRMVMDRPP